MPKQKNNPKIYCENCGPEGQINVTKGPPVESKDCPNCHVLGVNKKPAPPKITPPPRTFR